MKQKNDIPILDSWHNAFLYLEQYLEHCNENRKVLFFDEMPWMDTQGSEFVAELEYFWANWVQNRDDIVFIACGSATSWMKEKLEDNQGGLHNRITHRIYLRPFYLSDRKALFTEMTGTTRGAVHTFITPMGVAQGAHSSIVHSQLTATDLFANV